MASKLIDLKQAAEMLGVSTDKLNELRSSGKIHGYRDGASWMFKRDEVEKLAEARGSEGDAGEDDDLVSNESILVDDEPGGGGSTIIGQTGGKSEGSDIQLSTDDDGDVDLDSGPTDPSAGGSDVSLVPETGFGSDVRLDSSGSDVELVGGEKAGADDDMGLGSDISLGDSDLSDDASDLSLDDSGIKASESDLSLGDDLSLGEEDDDSIGLASGSDVSLAGDDDDDLVLGSGSDVGSDVGSGLGDSGINLASPADSGLALDDPPDELGGSAVDSLELPEDDDVIALDDDLADPDAATQLKADNDFLLTPVDDGIDDESDSGSQVIALDTEELDPDSATQLGMQGDGSEPQPLLVEEVDALPDDEDQVGLGPATGPSALAPQTAPEAPYSIWNILLLMPVCLTLVFAGLLMGDLMMNLWSWDQANTYTTGIMDGIINGLGL